MFIFSKSPVWYQKQITFLKIIAKVLPSPIPPPLASSLAERELSCLLLSLLTCDMIA